MFAALIQPLLAFDLPEIIFGLIALVFVIIRQLFEANKAAGANRPKPGVPQPQRPNDPKTAAPAVAAGQQADPLRAQVEEFLRRAGQTPQGQPKPKSGQSSQIEMLVVPSQPNEQRTIGQPLRQAEWRQTPSSSASPQSARGTEKARRASRSGKSGQRQTVAEHVAAQVTSRADSLGAQASRLGQRIAAEDQQFDTQIKAKFDHSVGTLAGSESTSAVPLVPTSTDSPAAQLAAMLANPVGIQQAVIVNEILRRPSDRW